MEEKDIMLSESELQEQIDKLKKKVTIKDVIIVIEIIVIIILIVFFGYSLKR